MTAACRDPSLPETAVECAGVSAGRGRFEAPPSRGAMSPREAVRVSCSWVSELSGRVFSLARAEFNTKGCRGKNGRRGKAPPSGTVGAGDLQVLIVEGKIRTTCPVERSFRLRPVLALLAPTCQVNPLEFEKEKETKRNVDYNTALAKLSIVRLWARGVYSCHAWS